ncbi:ornithine cyclodeaminase family protein [Shinella zoogloeoides]|uniref:ornithine cyclodeaminase family protein n=1 Tax=Shinella zoogloeoides TaxID=352475 RepID=UPI001F5A57A9|nr:ornithine cyclodeaminase [Shinella zoogloeoides]
MHNLFHLGADDVRRHLPGNTAIEALRRFHAGQSMPITDRQVVRDRSPSTNTFASLTAWSPGRYIAVKLVGAFPGNPALPSPEPAVQGLVALFDGTTGRPLMTCDGAALTQVKTAADSALAAELLSRPDSSTLLLVGAGGLAAEFATAMRVVRPSINRILVWNRSGGRADALAAALSETHCEAEAVSDLSAALSEADIVSALTMSETPIVLGREVKAGVHIDLVGSYLPEMREGDDELIRRSGRIYVDTLFDCRNSGDICQPLASGALRDDMIAGDLFELCTAKTVGRRDDRDITLFKNIGGAHLDLVVAAELYRSVLLQRNGSCNSG